ncbi:MAG: double-strand break repair helicase AddA [Rhodospirillaceae bacterium]|nr:double-strand break repair helicase AddA [Rhodospirillaceae bacterium]
MSGPMTETRRQATEVQQTAGRPGDSHWVSANAGTGKTHVLTNRIVRLLMSGVQPRTILCLTYTKAAAMEMANRLGALLGKWAVMDDDALMDSYRDQTGVPLDDDDLARVRRLFAEVADTTDGPNIRTIHSFCESLLGRFPLEAGVAPHFKVMDERTAAELRKDARDRLLARAAADPASPAARAMDHLAGVLGETGFDDMVTELDFARGKLAALFAHYGDAAGLAAATRRNLGLTPEDDRRSVIANALAADEVGLRRAVTALSGGSKRDKGYAEIIAPWLAADADGRAAGFADYAPAFLTQTHSPRKDLVTKKVAEANPGVREALEAEQARVLAIDEKLRALAIAENTAALMDLAEVMAREYAGLKEARALMDYDDLILKTRDLLRRSDGAVNWVHYKLDGGIAHVLVDEAQDTAPAQWDILEKLTEEFFAGEGAWDAGARGPRTVFAVGDEKQSIYSFQGAEPTRFEQTRAAFAAKARAAGMETTLERSLEMAVSFRSTWPVLDAVDKTFQPEALRASLTTTDRAIRHLVDRDGDAGRVELWPTVTPEDEDEADAWDAPVDKPGPRAPLVQVAETIADTIDGWLANGEVLASQGRSLNAGDILILVRRRGRFMEEMVRQLKLRGIKVAGTDRMILTEQMAVMDLIALGRFVLLPDDDLTLATVLKGPLFNFTDDDDLTPLCNPRRGTLWAELRARADEHPHWRAAADRLADLLASADQAPPFEFYANLLGPGGGRAAFHRHLGQDALDPMEEFLGLALQFEREHAPSLEGFLHWIGAGETVVKRDLEQAGSQVRVMTVHGAKGLEAPVVFLPDTCAATGRGKPIGLLWDRDTDGGAVYWPGRKDDDCDLTATLRAQVQAAQENEERRLLYVAMTRARDRLYVTGWEAKNGRAEGCWYDLIEAGLERAGAVEADVPGGRGLRLESPQTAEVRAKDLAAAPPDLPVPDWIDRPPAEEPDPPKPLAPSRPEDGPSAASPLGGDDGARFKRGLIVHKLLESLPDLAPAERRAAAERYLARPAHDLDDRQQAEILAETLALLDDPTLAPLFGPGSRAEVPLVAQAGGRVISARIDRLLVTDTEVLIADFKTNRPPPDRLEDVHPGYIAQMAGYRRALMDLYPNRPVRCALIWTMGARLMPLPDAILDEAGP